MSDDITPAEALGVNIAARLPDDIRAQLRAWIDQELALINDRAV